MPRHPDQHDFARRLGGFALCGGLHGQQVRNSRFFGIASRRAVEAAAGACLRRLPDLRRHARHLSRRQLHRPLDRAAAAGARPAPGGRRDRLAGEEAASFGLRRRAGVAGHPRPCRGTGLGCPDHDAADGVFARPCRPGRAHGRQPVRTLEGQCGRRRLSCKPRAKGRRRRRGGCGRRSGCSGLVGFAARAPLGLRCVSRLLLQPRAAQPAFFNEARSTGPCWLLKVGPSFPPDCATPEIR
ncbi:hypothetical protein VARIO8X_120371 [Burkholderiales bacterium 8X]|nr:hypothetical protein VARIO8X_120371 [Burkholderiales bacterium 8X]